MTEKIHTLKNTTSTICCFVINNKPYILYSCPPVSIQVVVYKLYLYTNYIDIKFNLN